jgi:hypothetical protein
MEPETVLSPRFAYPGVASHRLRQPAMQRLLGCACKAVLPAAHGTRAFHEPITDYPFIAPDGTAHSSHSQPPPSSSEVSYRNGLHAI